MSTNSRIYYPPHMSDRSTVSTSALACINPVKPGADGDYIHDVQNNSYRPQPPALFLFLA